MVESEEKSVFIENLSYPFAARSPLCADEIMASDGSMRKVSGILESWKCGIMKNDLLIIESMFSRDSNSSQKIVACLLYTSDAADDLIGVDLGGGGGL